MRFGPCLIVKSTDHCTGGYRISPLGLNSLCWLRPSVHLPTESAADRWLANFVASLGRLLVLVDARRRKRVVANTVGHRFKAGRRSGGGLVVGNTSARSTSQIV